MKNKPTRHKETNTFQFKPFSERISDIDIDVFHRVAHRNEETEEVETYFYEALQKWNFLNLTEGYYNFKTEVRNIVTLPQLLNQKQHVIDKLIEYLEKKDPLFLQPILELVVAVAKDLQKEFYEHFPRFLAVIIDLLHIKDAEQIEYTFTCLAYLFKFLWRYLVKNVKTVFELLLPLLSDSQPAYVNNFAAESFSFVVRKVKDKDSFIRTVLSVLEGKPNGVPGCGRLLYEVVAGTPGQFHSCAEPMLTLYFSTLHDRSIDQTIAYDVLKQVVQCTVQNIHPQRCGVLWSVLLNSIDKATVTSGVEGRSSSMIPVMRLLRIAIKHKNGRLVGDPVPLVTRLVQAMERFSTDKNDILQEIIETAVAVLLAGNVKMMQETSSQILLKLMATKDMKLLYGAVESLIPYSSFETLVLPQLMRHSVSIGFDEQTLRLFAKIVKEKSPPSLGGIGLENWRKYVLDIRGAQVGSIDYLVEQLNSVSESGLTENGVRVLMILPHLKPLPEILKDTLFEVVLSLYSKTLHCKSGEKLDSLCFSFLLAMESAVHVSTANELHEFLTGNEIKILDLVVKYPASRLVLNLIDLCVTNFSGSEVRDEYLNKVVFDLLNGHLVNHLGSPFGEVRLTATHLYSMFTCEEISGRCPDNTRSALELIYLAEKEPISVQTFRERLQHLQALSFESGSVRNLRKEYQEVPLRYLLGNLYVNFSLLWEPVSKIVASYADKSCEQFWPVFLSSLKQEGLNDQDYKPLFQCETLVEVESSVRRSIDKPDYQNFKVLLWKCMSQFPSYCEARNRDLTGLFIDFVNENFFKSNSEDAKSFSIIKSKGTKGEERAEAEESSDSEEDKEETEKDKEEIEKEERMEIEKDDDEEASRKSPADTRKPLPATRGYKLKLLLAQLEIFMNVSNPRSLYREPEMHRIYLDLLSSKSPDVQRAALNCILAYKHKYLLPYKENLLNLVNERNLKNELARFKVDQDSAMIQEDHREGLVPILMRIIYSKMVVKTGMRTGGKGGGIVRRKMILRFLGGTQENEMIVFVQMAFKPFRRYLELEQLEKVDLRQVVARIVETTDLSNVMPPKRLQSAVNLLAIVIEQFGSKMAKKLLPYLLALVICVLAEVVGILRRSEEVFAPYLQAVKNVRTSCINILSRFFGHYEDYDWTVQEIDALFDVAVFPWLEKLPVEGIHSPTALLKLFTAWSQNSRYYPLLIKHRPDDRSVNPLGILMKVLLGPKTHQSVVNGVMDIVERLVTMQDYGKVNENEMEVDRPLLPLTGLNNLLDIDQKMIGRGVNYGSTILLPHVPDVLEYIKNRLKRSNKWVNKTELVVLSRISEFVTEPESCDTLLGLTLPILVKKAASGDSEETIVELLTTAINLARNVDKPEVHVRGITPLLGTINTVPARKLLMELYTTIARGSSEGCRETLIKNCDLLTDLNAWDQRWLDQPDFQRRLDAFARIDSMAESNEITLEFGVAIIYNCFYFLKSVTDLAIKDYAGQCLRFIGPRLARAHKENPVDRRYLMDDTILAILRKGITSKVEAVRLQSIGLLGHMAIECPEVHPVLRDLSLFTNKLDPEVDFFENTQHLQLHRRGRALLKFCGIARTLKKPLNPRTLTQFILPLAATYLCNEVYHQKNSLVDAAIETVGTICRLVPWYHYEIILKYYLDKLRVCVEYQKQLVRVIVAILDAFHYDLSKYKPAQAVLESATAEVEVKVKEVKEVQVKEVQGKEDEVEVANDETKGENLLERIKDDIEEAEERLEEALNRDNADQLEETEVSKEDLPIVERQTVLSPYVTRKVVFSISKGLLSQLHRAIVARTQHENSHKVNRKKVAADNEEEELLRVPIALALVKLLQKLPEGMLDQNLPGIFMKLCTFLKSRLESVRRATREILQKIMITLGPKYLHHLLREMNTLLTKGFQVHVLAYTVQSVLVTLKPYFQKLDINQNLQSILSVCKVDLFGLTADEKEVAGIVKNVSEARSTKSYDIFHILAQFITESCLLDLILPLKEVLWRTHSHKTVQKVVECLRNVSLGLADNSYIPVEQILIFLYGVVSESIPELLPEKRKPVTEKEAEAIAREKPDCFIIPPEPKSRMGLKAVAKTAKNTNAHVIVEFGLKLCHILLKRDKVSGPGFKPFVDPFVPLLSDCLKSQHVKLSARALQCLSWTLKMNLDSSQDLMPEISSSIFGILHKYAAAGLSKGDNFDLVMAAFKCMAVIVRDVKSFTISTDQLKVLILYAEQDLHDREKQATAFTLLKAIIARKMVVPEMQAVMEKVAALSITSELEHVRVQSRSVFYTYLMEYPLGKQLDKHISFYLTQLSYQMQYGRMSALEMLHSIITGFPLKALLIRSGLIFLMAGARLVNDDDPTCRKLCAKCIKEMVARIPYNKRTKLFEIVLEWLNDYKIMHRTLAAQLCGIFVNVEKETFEARLKDVLPLLLKQFHANFDEKEGQAGRFVRIQPEGQKSLREISGNIKDPERTKDHHKFQVLQLLLKISAHCPGFLKNDEHRETVRSFAEYCHSLLAHPHIWVRLAASQMLGFVLATLDVEKVSRLLENNEEKEAREEEAREEEAREEEVVDEVKGYMYTDTGDTLRRLTLDLVGQLQPDLGLEELADQVVKNLIFIARILKSVRSNEGTAEAKMDESARLSLPWLVRRLRKAVNMEIVRAPKSGAVRTAVFKWTAGVIATIPIEDLRPVLFSLMSPLAREMSSTDEGSVGLRRLAKEAATMIKKRIGNEEYTRLLNQAQQRLDIRKAERRKLRTQQFVTDPELAAKRKIARQQKKKQSRKRKLDTVRGKKRAKKRPRKEEEVDMELV